MSLDNLTLGSKLRDARKNAGYTIAQVSEVTRIRETLISNLESDNFETCGGYAYARGHIRTIAKLFNLDSDALIEDFANATGEFDRPMIDLLTENNVTAPKPQRAKVSYKTLASGAVAVLVLLIAIPTVSSFFSSNKAATPAPSAGATASQNGQSTSEAANTVATKSSGVTVVLTGTSGKSWVGIQDSSGAQVFSGSISAGESKTFTDSTQLQVVIGNAGAVSLNVNGKDLGISGAVGEVVHLSFDQNGSTQG
jgi:cytoskeleton protein RodZ